MLWLGEEVSPVILLFRLGTECSTVQKWDFRKRLAYEGSVSGLAPPSCYNLLVVVRGVKMRRWG